MALYTILFCLSLFMIALVVAVIKKMFFRWKEEHKIERMVRLTTVERPAVSVMINTEKCVFRRRTYTDNIDIYDIITKSDINLTKGHELEGSNHAIPETGAK